MNELMNQVFEFLTGLSLHVWVAAFGVVVITIVFVFQRISMAKKTVGKIEIGEDHSERTSKGLAQSRQIEALIRRLIIWRRPEDAKKILKLAPDTAAFFVFMEALKKDSIASVLQNWLKKNPDGLLLREMAFSAQGRDFDGTKARRLLSFCMEEVRELSGDPEWPVRFFALRVLLADDHPRSIRLIWDFFSDSHPLIRRTVAEEGGRENQNKLFDALKSMVFDDPRPEVRRIARNRIESIFPHRWKMYPADMSALQSIHVLDQLEIPSKEDENVAIWALKGDVMEARLAAARYLEKSGALEKIFLEANRGDLEDWERRYELLSRAASVEIIDFIDHLKSADSVDILLLGSRLLSEGGDCRLISPLVQKAFSKIHPIKSADDEEFCRSAVHLACMRGDEKACSLVRDQLKAYSRDKDVLDFLLSLLPPEGVAVFRDVLLGFLEDPDFPSDEAFLKLMAELPPKMFLGPIVDILEAHQSVHPHVVRLRALLTLGAWRLDQTLLIILENLWILPKTHIREFSKHLAAMNRQAFQERASFILASSDAGMQAALISCLPFLGIGAFIEVIQKGLSDAHPEVRIACLEALFDAGELKAAGPALDLLQDPVEKVRLKAARVAGEKATKKFLMPLEAILSDGTEAESVRIAALEGLACSTVTESLDAMLRFLDSGKDLRDELMRTMAKKTDKKQIAVLVENFKDSQAPLRDKILKVLAVMGEKGEKALVELLDDGSASLKPVLADILTRMGFVEILIRHLEHRKPEIRRRASALLANIATESAYRGIILAGRDPDGEVRKNVTHALEFLKTPEGQEIRQSLENNPDPKIRHCTHWVIKRLKT